MNTTQETNPLSSGYPGPQEEKGYSIVLLCGLATTALALLGVYVMDQKASDFHIMGWYADYVLPLGAVTVGIAASCGYGIASWFSGVKITKSLLWIVLALQIGAYFAAQYIDFAGRHLVHRSTGKPVGFFEYYDLIARSIAWREENGKSGEPLGVWGYAIRGLEMIGFVGGSLLIPAAMRKVPYCQACQRYMKSQQLTFFPGSVPARKFKKSDPVGIDGAAEYDREQEQAFEQGQKTWEGLRQLADGSRATEFQTRLIDLSAGKKAALKLPRRFGLKVVRCKRCASGWLQLQVVTGHGKQIKQTDFERLELKPEFVRSVWPV